MANRTNQAALHQLATTLGKRNTTMMLDDVSHWLNAGGYRTTYGTQYQIGGRGVAKLVASTYWYVHTELGLGTPGAHVVAKAFTNKDGKYAYNYY